VAEVDRRLAVTVAEPSDPPGTATLVRAAGDVDTATCEQLWPVLEAALRERRPVALDASRVVFMDTAGLAVLLRADAFARAMATPFVVVAPPDALLRLFARSKAAARLRVTPPIGNVGTPGACGAGCDGFGAEYL
jgi:anti-sigma B factor antagonist